MLFIFIMMKIIKIKDPQGELNLENDFQILLRWLAGH